MPQGRVVVPSEAVVLLLSCGNGWHCDAGMEDRREDSITVNLD